GHKNTPIWLTEVGYTTYAGGVTTTDQAKYMMRLYAQAFSISGVRKIFWYSFTDTSSDSSLLEAKFGMIDHNFDPKPAFEAHKFLVENLNQKRFQDQALPELYPIDYFGTAQKWEFQNTVCTSGTLNNRNGENMVVTYKFTQNANCYAPVVLNKPIPMNVRSLQFKARGEGDNTILRVRMRDASGETFQYNAGLMPNEWLYYDISLFSFAAHWGGNNNGWVDFP